MMALKLKQSSINCLAGHILIAMPQLRDPRFNHSLVLVCAHDEMGAMGIIVNKLLDDLKLDDLLRKLAITHYPAASHLPIYYGGPVEMGRGFILHSADFLRESSVLINSSIAITATLDMLSVIAEGRGPSKKLCALGYAGWGAGQLEQELQSNSWLQVPASDQLIFDIPIGERWLAALGQLGISPDLLSLDVGHA